MYLYINHVYIIRQVYMYYSSIHSWCEHLDDVLMCERGTMFVCANSQKMFFCATMTQKMYVGVAKALHKKICQVVVARDLRGTGRNFAACSPRWDRRINHHATFFFGVRTLIRLGLSCHCQVTTLELSRGPKCDDKYKFIKTAREPTSRLWIESAGFFTQALTLTAVA